MRRVVIESPYAGDVERNRKYLNGCLLDSYRSGEAPIASHRDGPNALDDLDADQRDTGIVAGHAWCKVADVVAFYLDFGFSSGMVRTLNMLDATGEFERVELRFLGDEPARSLYMQAALSFNGFESPLRLQVVTHGRHRSPAMEWSRRCDANIADLEGHGDEPPISPMRPLVEHQVADPKRSWLSRWVLG